MAGPFDFFPQLQEDMNLQNTVATTNPQATQEQILKNLIATDPSSVVKDNALAKPAPMPQAAVQPKLSYATEYENALKDSMARRQSANDDLNAQLKEKLGRQFGWLETANLQPAMAFADSLVGGRSAASYQAPTAKKDNQLQAEKLQEQIRKSEEGMSNDQLDYLKLRLQEEMAGKREDRMMNRMGMNVASQMRNQWLTNPTTKHSQDVATSYEKVMSAANDPSAAGDLSLIFGYMKMLDPGSVVREGEFATAQNATGVPDRVRNMWNRALNGERLNATQRADFINQAKNVFDSQIMQQQRFDDGFNEIAKNAGVNPNDVVIPGLFKIKNKMANAHDEALAWAQANPNDPRSAKILQRLKVK